MLNTEDSILFIVDIQEKLLNAVFNKELLEKKAGIITKVASIIGLPVIITEQYPKGLGNTIETIKNIETNSHYFEKTSFNALEDNSLLEKITNLKKKDIIIMGIETHICVYQTATDLLDKGFNVTIVKDACGSRTETEYTNALECLKSQGANIKTTEMIIFELIKSAKHPNFKEIQTLIK